MGDTQRSQGPIGAAPPQVPDRAVSAAEIRRLAALKFELLASGLKLTSAASAALAGAKTPIRTRSGISGGLDIILPHEIHVNVPVQEGFAAKSSLTLDTSLSSLGIFRNGTLLSEAKIQPEPSYYHRRTADGTEEMVRIGQMCSGDRFCYGMTGPGCYFWGSKKRCRYCSIGFNYDADAAKKAKSQLIEVLDAAMADPSLPARHILLGGGTPPGEDMGAVLASELCREIKARYDVSIYVMIAAPLKDAYIDLLRESGADELGMNLEFWSEEAWRSFIPGKYMEIGKSRYLKALEHAVRVFGPINTRSIFIAGLEPAEETIAGALHVASMGVMPIISPFRPLANTMLADRSGFTGDQYLEMWDAMDKAVANFGVPLGPTCIACQNNTLALPFGSLYHHY